MCVVYTNSTAIVKDDVPMAITLINCEMSLTLLLSSCTSPPVSLFLPAHTLVPTEILSKGDDLTYLDRHVSAGGKLGAGTLS